MRRVVLLLVGLLAIALAGCGGGGTEAVTTATTPQTEAPVSGIGRWVITDLGTLGGPVSWAIAVNDKGQVVGASDTKSGKTHAFLWQDGRMRDLGSLAIFATIEINNRGQILGDDAVWQNGKVTDLGTLGGDQTIAHAINDRGQVVGFSYPRGKSNHAFLWKNGRMRDLGTLGGHASDATAINERGQVVGESDIKARDEFGHDLHHAFLWQNGAMRDLGTLGGPESKAYAIKERGQVVGESDIKRRTKDGYTIKHAFLWQNGEMTDIGAFKRAPGDRLGLPPESHAFAINERGQILGSSDYGSFVWQQGKRRMIGTLGGRESDADALSDRGEVVGGAETNATKNWPLVSHGFVWQNGKMIDLGVLRPRDRFSVAVSINAARTVVGMSAPCDPREPGITNECRRHAVLWTLKRG